MSFLNKVKAAATKAGGQASTFLSEATAKGMQEGQGFAQSFSLPGESEKAAKILASFLGAHLFPCIHLR
jgi:hypothetical protein